MANIRYPRSELLIALFANICLNPPMAKTYKESGVDTAAGDALVDWLQSDTAAPAFRENIVSGIGGFAALFRLGFKDMKSPVLVSATDGVGTKIKLAADFARYDTIGQDLVAMCVNDLICTGGFPLFFLDYYATGKLRLEESKEFLAGVKRACANSDCALIGGETAEMPGIYHGNDFDAAGFAVGLVDEPEILRAENVRHGDLVIGVSSSGFHSNGYSLLRQLYAADLQREAKLGGGPVSSMLLRPTHLYVRLASRIRKLVSGIAHITGGGMENIPRVLPKGARLELTHWQWPSEFIEVQDRSGLDRVQMLNTFNCGIGLVLILNPKEQSQVMSEVLAAGFKAIELGQIELKSGQNDAEIVL